MKFIRTTAAGLAVAQVNAEALGSKEVTPVIQSVDQTESLPQSTYQDDGSFTMSTLGVSIKRPITKWTKELEQEFRALVLAEATEKIDAAGFERLKNLDHARELLDNPRSAGEIELQLKRDSLLKKMSESFDQFLLLKKWGASNAEHRQLKR